MTFEDYGIYSGATIFLEYKCRVNHADIYSNAPSRNHKLNINEPESSTYVYEDPITREFHTNGDLPLQAQKQNVQTNQTISNRCSQIRYSNTVTLSNKTTYAGTNTKMTKVDVIQTLSRFEEVLKDNTKVAVNFISSWGRQNEGINLKFAEAVVIYPKIKFIIVKIIENRDIAIKYHVYSETFRLYKNGTVFSRLMFSRNYDLYEELKQLSDSIIISTPKRIDDTSLSSACESPSYNPFATISDHNTNPLKECIDSEPVDTLSTEYLSSTYKSPSYNPFAINSDHKVDPLNEFLVEIENLLNPQDCDSKCDKSGIESKQYLETNQTTGISNNISNDQSFYTNELIQTEPDDLYFSPRASRIDSMHTNTSPLSGCTHPNYSTFSSDSGLYKVDQGNNLSDYVPGKIISTHFYEPPRRYRSKYGVSNNSPYIHANSSASRHTTRTNTQTRQLGSIIHSNTRVQTNTVPNAMNSAYPPTIPKTQNSQVLPHNTRRKSYRSYFCCICLFTTLIVVFLTCVVVIIVCIFNF